MRRSVKDRHLYGVGAAACAVCCTTPLVAVLGLTGAAATAATFALAGVTFAVVVGGAALTLTLIRRRAEGAQHCSPTQSGPIDVTIGPPG